jgi:hypothetical protein
MLRSTGDSSEIPIRRNLRRIQDLIPEMLPFMRAANPGRPGHLPPDSRNQTAHPYKKSTPVGYSGLLRLKEKPTTRRPLILPMKEGKEYNSTSRRVFWPDRTCRLSRFSFRMKYIFQYPAEVELNIRGIFWKYKIAFHFFYDQTYLQPAWFISLLLPIPSISRHLPQRKYRFRFLVVTTMHQTICSSFSEAAFP